MPLRIPCFFFFPFCALVLLSCTALAEEGFQPSFHKNVVMLKTRTSGFSAFALRLGEKVEIVAPLSRLGPALTLQRGNAVGLFYRLKAEEPRAFQREFEGKMRASSESDDVALFSLRSSLDPDSPGLEATGFQEGPARLVGYPILFRRGCSNAFFCFFRDIWGGVRQMESRGRVWKEGNRFFGDMDALPGSEGSAVLNEEGKVMGMLLGLELSGEDHYAYRRPTFRFVPILPLLQKIKPTSP